MVAINWYIANVAVPQDVVLWCQSVIRAHSQPVSHSLHLIFYKCHNIYFTTALLLGRDVALMTGESNHSFSLFQHTPKTFNGVKSGKFMCENDSSYSLTLTTIC